MLKNYVLKNFVLKNFGLKKFRVKKFRVKKFRVKKFRVKKFRVEKFPVEKKFPTILTKISIQGQFRVFETRCENNLINQLMLSEKSDKFQT